MKKIITTLFIFCFFFFGNESKLCAQQWYNWTSTDNVYDIAEHAGKIYAATDGGIIEIDTATDLQRFYNRSNSGLAYNNVRQIEFDSQGNMWVGFRITGLQKFDGVSWTSYQYSTTNDTIDEVSDIVIDKLDNIWFVNYHNIAFAQFTVFKVSNNVLQKIINPFTSSPLVCRDICMDTTGNLYFASYTNFLKYDGSLWTSIPYPGTFPYKIEAEPNGHLWVKDATSTYPVYFYDGSSWSNIDASYFGFSSNHLLRSVTSDPQGNIWFTCDSSGFIKVSNFNQTFYPYDSLNAPGKVTGLFYKATNDKFWAYFYQNTKKLRCLNNSQWKSHSLSIAPMGSFRANGVGVDHNNIKFFSDEISIYRFDGFSRQLLFASAFPMSGCCNKILIDHGNNAWFYTYSGSSNSPLIVKYDGSNYTPYYVTSFGNNIHNAQDAAVDNNGDIWVGTVYGGLCKVSGGVTSSYNIDVSANYNNISSVAVDKNNHVWCSKYSDFLYEFDGSGFVKYDNTNSPINGSGKLFVDHIGNLWVGGQTIYDPLYKKDTAGNWTTYTQASVPQLYRGISDITEDHNGNMWFACEGLVKFDGTTWTKYDIYNSGCPGNGIYDLDVDDYNNIWIASSDGGFAVFNENGLENQTITEPNYKISGKVYYDKNSNGIKDTNDILMPLQRTLLLPDSIYLFTNTDTSNNYSYFVKQGNYEVQYAPVGNWQLTSDSASYQVSIIDSSKTGYDFGAYCNGTLDSLSISLTGSTSRCNAIAAYWIDYSNKGLLSSGGVIYFLSDDSVTLVQSTPPPNYINGDTLFWNYAGLQPGEQRQILVIYNLPGVNTVNNTLRFDTRIISVTGIIANDSLVQHVTCAYDPNDKLVRPKGLTPPHYRTLMNETLEYTIRFQNTGNDTAFTVVVLDTIDADLDMNTFEIVASSHPVITTFKTSGTIKFRFDNIKLPYEDQNETGSNGFVKYKIRAKQNLPDVTPVTNRAYIIFDFNPAIRTNKTLNTMVYSLVGIEELASQQNDFSVYPNPANDFISLHFKNTFNDDAVIAISNSLGQVVKEFNHLSLKNNNDATLLIDGFSKGLYFISVKTSKQFLKSKFSVSQ